MAKKDDMNKETWREPKSEKIVVLGYLGKVIGNKEQSYELVDDDKGMLPVELQNAKNGKVVIKAYDNAIERD